MSSINVRPEDKARFADLKPDEKTQKEFFAEVMRTYEHADETVTVDTDASVERVSMATAAEIETAAFRGVTDAIEAAQE